MKTRDDLVAEADGADNPLQANWPIIRITAYLIVGGILMTLIVTAFPPDPLPAKAPVAATSASRP